MNGRCRWLGRAATVIVAASVIVMTTMAISALPADADDCPEGGAVRFGVEPFDTAPRLAPVYERIGTLLGEKIGCKVQVFVATSYNAEIEAMRSSKLDIGEFGPLGYVLAHQIAKAEAVAAYSNKDGKPDTYWASIVTYPSSGITTVAGISGRSFAFSDPASTSGHLFPAFALRKAARQSMPGVTRRPLKRSTIRKSTLGSSTARNLNPPGSAAITTTAIWCSCGSPTLFPLIRLRCAAIFLKVSRGG
jgi:phosphate/phosphite/phosphonate ABC transporter binding protein